MKRRVTISFLLFALLFVSFNVAFICFIFNKQFNLALSWILFAFSNLLIIEGFVASFFALKPEQLGHRIYSIPILIKVFSVISVQAVASIICFIINSFFELQSFVALIISILTFVAFHAFLIINFAHKESIVAMETKEESFNDLFIKEMKNKSNGLFIRYKEKIGVEKLKSLKEAFAYATPFTTEDNSDVENRISDLMNSLETSLMDGDCTYSLEIIDEILVLLKERENISVK